MQPEAPQDPTPRTPQISDTRNARQPGAPVSVVPHEGTSQTVARPPRIRTNRFGHLEEHELIKLLDTIEDERARGRFRESIYISLIRLAGDRLGPVLRPKVSVALSAADHPGRRAAPAGSRAAERAGFAAPCGGASAED
jgi:hypothetical protein